MRGVLKMPKYWQLPKYWQAYFFRWIFNFFIRASKVVRLMPKISDIN